MSIVHGFNEGFIPVSIIIRESFVSLWSNLVRDVPLMMGTFAHYAINALSSYEEGYCDIVVVG